MKDDLCLNMKTNEEVSKDLKLLQSKIEKESKQN